ncbi:MAG TPA: hypothetical protein VLJ80_08310 [Solirubrobacteraceae bacterium]|nr:hypothetical protein [Solirubrobacteraceae bacterium]
MIEVYSPLRADLVGGPSDVDPYPETAGGEVVNAALDEWVCVRVFVGPARSAMEPERQETGALVRAALADCLRSTPDLKIQVATPLPGWQGLGTSSAIAVGLALGIAHACDEYELSSTEICRRAEAIEEAAGIVGGRQDRCASVFGGVAVYNFGAGGAVTRESIGGAAAVLLEHAVLLREPGSRDSSAVVSDVLARYSAGDASVAAALSAGVKLTRSVAAALASGDCHEFSQVVQTIASIQEALSDKIRDSIQQSELRKLIDDFSGVGKQLGAGGRGSTWLALVPDPAALTVRAAEQGVESRGLSVSARGAYVSKAVAPSCRPGLTSA